MTETQRSLQPGGEPITEPARGLEVRDPGWNRDAIALLLVEIGERGLSDRHRAELQRLVEHVGFRDSPSVFSLPAEPGPEVTELWDAAGDRWLRGVDRDGVWFQDNDPDFGMSWAEVIDSFGPLSTAPPETETEPIVDRCLNCNAPLVRRGGRLVHRDGDPDRCPPAAGAVL